MVREATSARRWSGDMLEPNGGRPSDVHIYQRVQQADPLPPETEQCFVPGRAASQLRHLELLVDRSDLLLELIGHADGAAIGDPRFGIVRLDHLLQLLRA